MLLIFPILAPKLTFQPSSPPPAPPLLRRGFLLSGMYTLPGFVHLLPSPQGGRPADGSEAPSPRSAMRHHFGRQPEPWSWPTSLWAASVGNRKRPAFEGRCILSKHGSSKARMLRHSLVSRRRPLTRPGPRARTGSPGLRRLGQNGPDLVPIQPLRNEFELFSCRVGSPFPHP